MSLNDTPSGERIHIGIFGKRNAGKSTLFNALTGQDIAIVSDKPGTTTDPVSKAMELLPLGPVLITDTPGLDDSGDVGQLRVKKAEEILRNTDIAIIVINAVYGVSEEDTILIEEIEKKNLPYIICFNKTDEADDIEKEQIIAKKSGYCMYVSAKSGQGIGELKEKIVSLDVKTDKHLISDLIDPLDTIVLVVPIDKAAPKGRLILPQQQVIRDALEVGATVIVTRDEELKDTLLKLREKPKAVITDSQAFNKVKDIVPDEIYLTSFSILMARYKGDLEWQVEGARAIDTLDSGSRILISEGCSHHRQCGDIGTEKLPKWIKEYTGKEFVFEFSSGREFPDDLSIYDMVIHCGGCTLNEKEMKYRISKAKENNVPITNYGVMISYMNGILKRSLRLLTNQHH